MSDIKRITPAEVMEAYRKTGLHIGRYAYFSKPAPSKRECACGLGVYCAANFGIKDEVGATRSVTQSMRAAGFNDSYLWGFISGFDGDEAPRKETDPEYIAGFVDGRAAYAACTAYAAAKEAAHV
jgi:hypothetical protein